MKQKLLYFILPLMFFAVTLQAQTKVWNFSDAAIWPASPGIGTDEKVVDQLGLFPISSNTNFGAINSNNTTFSDDLSRSMRFQLNGAGYTGSTFVAEPTQRYVYFNVHNYLLSTVLFINAKMSASKLCALIVVYLNSLYPASDIKLYFSQSSV